MTTEHDPALTAAIDEEIAAAQGLEPAAEVPDQPAHTVGDDILDDLKFVKRMCVVNQAATLVLMKHFRITDEEFGEALADVLSRYKARDTGAPQPPPTSAAGSGKEQGV